MGVSWTDEQIEAIESRGGNILVAAAAGSGKTTVLVERIIRMITDTEKPISVDRLLVLTFTEAAAAEMKRKISAAIDKKLEDLPDNEWLRQQSIKVGSACISTIDSFCRRTIANNAYLTELPSDFSMIDDTENDVLKAKVVDEVLEAYYSRMKPGFSELVTGFGGIKGDDALRGIVLDMYDFVRALAYPNRWFKYVKASYRNGDISDGKTVWEESLTGLIYKYVYEMREIIDVLYDLADREFEEDNYHMIYYRELRESFRTETECTKDVVGRDRLIGFLRGFKLPTERNQKDYEPERKKQIADLKKMINDRKKSALAIAAAFEDDTIERFKGCGDVVRTLCNIVCLTARLHSREKQERGVMDFSDLERGMLKLLCNSKGEETQLCAKLRDYYDEILLDEFQDTNNLQFEIFSRISKKEGNLFMVGDVKQSIYRFRNSDPSIFLRLYKEYSKGNGGRLIRLFKNFRSRDEVVDSVNYVFSTVMSEKSGGIDYVKDEYLIRGADYKEGGNYRTEIMIPDVEETEDEDSVPLCVAERIRRLVCEERLPVTDKQSGEIRPVRYGDIAVLAPGWAECREVEAALDSVGIAAMCEKSCHYLDSIEVSTLMAFLQIIDNPVQDIPLIAVMRSPMFAFSGDDLAEIRACNKEKSFYDALVTSAESNKKANDFLRILTELRESSKYMGVDEIVRKICNDLHYMAIVGAMDGGELKKANIKLLLARCADFESGALTGLFNFVKYIEMLKENKSDLKSASSDAEVGDIVRLMTVHKSKGLEFPVVVLYGTEKNFNYTDINKGIIWDSDLGIGISYFDSENRIKYNLPQKAVVRDKMLRETKAEQMRLLYVAVTRAKEKLIISSKLHARGSMYKKVCFDENGRVYPVFSCGADSMREWIWASVLKNETAGELRELAGRGDIVPSLSDFAEFEILTEIKPRGEVASFADKEYDLNDVDTKEIKDRLNYKYPFSAAARLPIKMSVSEMKRRRMPEEDLSFGLLKPPAALLNGEEEFSAAERGTVTHFVLQHIDFNKTATAAEVEIQTDEMVKRGMITDTQRAIVDTDAVFGFFNSELGRRLKKAEKSEREYDFYMLVPPSEADAEFSGDGAEDIILQGIADCIFYEDDGIVLVDFKTDRVSNESAHKRSEFYRIQTDYYARGLEAALGTVVKEKYLYFLNCGETVKMQ